MSANALIGNVHCVVCQPVELTERHNNCSENLIVLTQPDTDKVDRAPPSWHLPGDAMRRDLANVATRPRNLPWSAYDQLVLERARDFDLFRYDSAVATSAILGTGPDELPFWQELSPDVSRLETLRNRLIAEGVESVVTKWEAARDAAISTKDDTAEPTLANSCPGGLLDHPSWTWGAPSLQSSTAYAAAKTESEMLRGDKIWSLLSNTARKAGKQSKRSAKVVVRKASKDAIDDWSRNESLINAPNAVARAWAAYLPEWQAAGRVGRFGERHRFHNIWRNGDPGFSENAGYLSDDIAQLTKFGVPGMRREPLLSLEDEHTLDVWQIVNEAERLADAGQLQTDEAQRPELNFADATGSATVEELREAALALGLYLKGEVPGTKGLFRGIEEDWEEVRAEKASGYHEPSRWWREAGFYLLMRRRNESQRERVVRDVLQARERIARRKRPMHPLKGVPLPWPLDVAFCEGKTLAQIASEAWPKSRKDNALVKAARSFKTAMKRLRTTEAGS